MKKLIYLLVFMIGLPCWSFAQEMNKRVTDPNTKKEYLIGHCDREGLQAGTFGELYREYYSLYDPDKEITKKLKQHKEGLKILIVLGTWCSDSQEQVPKFMKILDKMKFSAQNLDMISVDREKKGGDIDVGPYNILYVPTFIFYKNGKEIGRIVESPVGSLEGDMLGFIGE